MEAIAQNLQAYWEQFTILLRFSPVCDVTAVCVIKNTLVLINWMLILSGLYYTVLVVLGFTIEEPEVVGVAPEKRFLILIPAHNESSVIGHTVKTFIDTMEYPRELYDIYVIADNCTDDTKQIALDNGAKVIVTTSGPNEPKGKPFAIQKALLELDDELVKTYDIITFIDADNLVKPNYLAIVNEEFVANGVRLVQAYLDVKNPNDNFVSTAYTAAYVSTNRFFEYSKSKLGLSASLGGTGFSIDAVLLKEIGWQCNTLTEDLEFQILSILNGVTPKYTMKTRTYDEKPLRVKQSLVQRSRWSRGHWTVAFRYFFPLLKGIITGKNNKRRVSLDALFYLLSPARAVAGFIMIPAVLYYSMRFDDWSVMFLMLGAFIIWFIPSFLISYAIKHDVHQEIKPNIFYIWAAAMFYSITFLFIYVWGLFTYKKTEWVRTEHASNQEIHDKIETNEDT